MPDDTIRVSTHVTVEVGATCIRSATYLVLAIAALIVALGWIIQSYPTTLD